MGDGHDGWKEGVNVNRGRRKRGKRSMGLRETRRAEGWCAHEAKYCIKKKKKKKKSRKTLYNLT